MKVPIAARFICCFCLAIAFGCGKASSNRQRVDVAVINHIGVELDKVNIQFGAHACYVGMLATNALKVHIYFEPPIGQTAEVTWLAPNGDRQRATTRLDGSFSSSKAGRLTFEMRADGVFASFLEFDANGNPQPSSVKP